MRRDAQLTTVEEDRTQARIDGLLEMLRAAETDFRRSYARVLEVVAEWEEQRAGAVSGFGTTARLLAGVLNLSKGEAKARAEQAGLLTPRQSLTGEVLPPALPATAGAGRRCDRTHPPTGDHPAAATSTTTPLSVVASSTSTHWTPSGPVKSTI